MLRLDARERAQLAAHAHRAYPAECCGALIGRQHGTTREVVRVVEMENRTTSDARRRYTIDPEALLQADQEAREAGLDLLGFYHSHPDHPAVPSETDRAEAWPHYAYLILGVVDGEVSDMRAWTLDREGGSFQPEPLDPPSP